MQTESKSIEAFEFFGLSGIESDEVIITPERFSDYMNTTRSLSSAIDYERFEHYVSGYLGSVGLGKLFKTKEERKDKREERKENRQEKKEERKEERANSEHKGLTVAKQILKVVNKVNPVTLAVRNALRALIALNFIGMASAINSKPELRKKVEEMYKNMGGEVKHLTNSVSDGAKRKPLFGKDSEKYNGLGSAAAGLIASAGPFLVKIWNWMKEFGIKAVKYAKDNKIIDKLKDSNIGDKISELRNKRDESKSQSETEDKPSMINAQDDSSGDKDADDSSGDKDADDEAKKKKRRRNMIFIGLGTLAVAGGLGYWAYSSRHDRTVHNSEKLAELKPLGYVKLK